MALPSLEAPSYVGGEGASSAAGSSGPAGSCKETRMKAILLTAALMLSASGSAAAPRTETAVLAGGCFWGMESVFEHVKGVTDVVSGYAGGSANDANYESADSGHAEAVRITYDPSKISYARLLQVFFA